MIFCLEINVGGFIYFHSTMSRFTASAILLLGMNPPVAENF